MKDYVAFDLETTGLSPDSDQIIEIGAVKIRDGRSVESITVSFIQRSKSVILSSI